MNSNHNYDILIMPFIKKSLTAATLILALLFILTNSQAREVSFSWKASTDSVDGYKLYYKTGNQGGPPYEHSVIISGQSTTTHTLRNLANNKAYHFTLTAFRTDGNLESDYAEELSLGAMPTAAFTTNLIAGRSLTVIVDAGSSTGFPSSYQWDFGDGSTLTGRSATHIYPVAGEYTITLTVQNGAGQDSTTHIIQIEKASLNTIPDAVISSGKVTGPAPLKTTFNASSSSDADKDPLRYSWNFGDGTATASGVQASHIFQTPGTYTTTLTVNDGKGGIASVTTPVIVTDGSGVTTSSTPAAKIIATKHSGSKELNGTFTVTLDGSRSAPSAPGASIVQYAWNFGDGTTANGAKVQHTYPSLQHYTATLTVTDSLGKQAVASMVLKAEALTDNRLGHLEAVYKLLLMKD